MQEFKNYTYYNRIHQQDSRYVATQAEAVDITLFFTFQLSAIIGRIGKKYPKEKLDGELMKISAKSGYVSTAAALYKLCSWDKAHPFVIMLRHVVSAW